MFLLIFLYYNLNKPNQNSFFVHLTFKGIVSRDFEGLQMILMNRKWVPVLDVSLGTTIYKTD